MAQAPAEAPPKTGSFQHASAAVAQTLRLVEAQLRVQHSGVAVRGAARWEPVDTLEQYAEVDGSGAAVWVEVERRLVGTAGVLRLAALLELFGSVDQRLGTRRHGSR